MGSGAKSHVRKVFLIYEEIRKYSQYMRRPLVIYDLHPTPLKFLIYEENFIFLLSVHKLSGASIHAVCINTGVFYVTCMKNLNQGLK